MDRLFVDLILKINKYIDNSNVVIPFYVNILVYFVQ